MPSEDLTLLGAYFDIEPFGPIRDNIHAGIITAMIANTHLKSGAKPYSADDFLLQDAQSRKEKETRNFMRSLAAVAVRG